MLALARAVSLAALVAALAGCGSDAPSGISRVFTPDRSQRVPRTIPDGDWSRFGYDAARSGVGPARTGITVFDLRSLRRRAIQIDGVADSSPIQLHAVRVAGRRRDVAIVTTTYGRTIAFDPGSGQRLWEYQPPGFASYAGTAQITTATPVADPGRRFVYAASPDGLIHKLAVASGREVRSAGWPARITLDARREKIGPALNLSGSRVLAATGGYIGDAPVYQGHVVAIGTATGAIANVWNSLCSDRRGLMVPRSCPASGSAIWARAGVVVEPDTGKLLVATGNGTFNGSADWGDSVLELAPGAARLLQNWTPTNQAQLNASDADLGSTAPAPLPVTGGRRLAVQGGKTGVLYLLDLARLNGTPTAGRRLGGELQRIAAPGGDQVFTAPAVWRASGRTFVFVADGSGTTGYALSDGAQPRLSVSWRASDPGTSPVVAGGLLYVYDEVHGTLNIRDPRTGALRAALAAGAGHWNSPIVVGGRIVLPVGGSSSDRDRSGTIYVYHLPGH